MSDMPQAATRDHFDIIVIGGGSIGLAAAHYAARGGSKVLVLERFGFFNDRGASGGNERQFRIQYNEKEISKLVLASLPLWRQLEAESSRELLKTVGCLWFGDPKVTGAEGQIEAVTQVMRELDVPFDPVGVGEIEGRYGFKDLPRTYTGFYQPQGAAINVQATLRTLHQSCRDSGRVTLQDHVALHGIHASPSSVVVDTDQGSFKAAKLIVTAGPYVNDVLALIGVQLDLAIWEMVGAYFRLTDPSLQFPTWISFDAKAGDDPMLYYGFPETDWADGAKYVRVAANYPVAVHREVGRRNREVDPGCVRRISRWVSRHMKGLDPKPLHPSNCICALVTEPENDWILRREIILDFAPETVPGRNNIVICASGWNYKIVPLLGKICVDLAVDGKTSHDLSKLKLSPDVLRPC